MSTAESLREKIATGLPAEHVEITDISGGCGQSFEALIVSASFEGMALLARHRKVNALLAEELKAIHAFTQKTLTPAQYQQQQQASK